MGLVSLTFWPYVPAYPPCSGKPLAGSANLQLACLERFESSFDYGIYNCRAMTTDSSTPSIHSDGRAGDVGFPDAVTGERLVTNPHPDGFVLLELLRSNAFDLGIMGIIWNRRRWDARTPWGREYFGPNPHINHVHWEQTPLIAGSLLLANARKLIGELPVAFTPQEEDALKRIAPYAKFLGELAAAIAGPGPVTGARGQPLSLLHVLETHRLVARQIGVGGDKHEAIAEALLSGRLLGQ